MEIVTDSERVQHSRKLVLELLGSSVDFSYAPAETQEYFGRYDAQPARFGPPMPAAEPGERDHAHTGHHHPAPDGIAATVLQPPKIDNELYVRDYSRCILCYKCVEACGTDHQNTFAISIAGRGFDARISTEFDTWLPDSACVYCGNCIERLPDRRADVRDRVRAARRKASWDEERQTTTDTICPYCGVGCTLRLHVQDNQIVQVTSPHDHERHGRQPLRQGPLRLAVSSRTALTRAGRSGGAVPEPSAQVERRMSSASATAAGPTTGTRWPARSRWRSGCSGGRTASGAAREHRRHDAHPRRRLRTGCRLPATAKASSPAARISSMSPSASTKTSRRCSTS